jgi:hypothetical protein
MLIVIIHNLLKILEKSDGNKFIEIHDISSVTLAFEDQEVRAHKVT